MAKKNRPIDIHAWDAAHQYWSLSPADRSWGVTANRLGLKATNKAHQNYLARLVRRYEEDGLVRHVVLRAPEQGKELPHRMPDRERELAREFGLRGAAVVDVGGLRKSPQYQRESQFIYLHFDYILYKTLARSAADFVLSLLRPADVLGMGGGRAPYWTAQFLSSRPGLGTRVVSLTGQLSTQLLIDVGDEEFDINTEADQVTQTVASKLGVQTTSKINMSLASEHTPAPAPRHLGKISLAVIGVGILTTGHPLERWEQSEDISRIKVELKRLWEAIGELDENNHHWCADISNHLFITSHSDVKKWESLPKRARTSLSKYVTDVNRRTVTAKVEHFQAITERGSVVLVAGGVHKHGAIRHILRQGQESKPWISHLVTDDSTADAMLGE